MLNLKRKNFLLFLKLLPIGVIIFLIFLFLNSGLQLLHDSEFEVLIFTLLILLLSSKIIEKLLLIYFVGFLYLLMVIAFVFEWNLVSTVSGSLLYGFVVILIAFYFPQLIRFGSVKKW